MKRLILLSLFALCLATALQADIYLTNNTREPIKFNMCWSDYTLWNGKWLNCLRNQDYGVPFESLPVVQPGKSMLIKGDLLFRKNKYQIWAKEINADWSTEPTASWDVSDDWNRWITITSKTIPSSFDDQGNETPSRKVYIYASSRHFPVGWGNTEVWTPEGKF